MIYPHCVFNTHNPRLQTLPLYIPVKTRQDQSARTDVTGLPLPG